MAAAKKPSAAKPARKKLADVAKPGTTAPAASAKPIIVTNRPLLQDPMMVGSDAPASPEAPAAEPAAAPPSAAKLTIRPITVLSPEDDDKKPVDVKTPETEVTEQEPAPDKILATAEKPAAVDAAPEPVEPPEAAATEDAAPAADAAQSDEAAGTPAPAEDTATKDEDKGTAEAEEKSDDVPASAQTPEQIDAAAQEAEKQAAEHAAAIEKLAESKQYYLPIATAEQRQAKRFIVLGIVLIVLLGLAWLDIALDAGLVHLQGVQPLTHFFAH